MESESISCTLNEKPTDISLPGFAPPVKSEQLPAGKKLTKDLVLSKSKGGSLIELKKIVIWGQKISDCSIVTEIPELEVASMTANQISTLEHFGQCPNLRELFLRSNCIQDIHQIYYLKDLPNLQVLWLAGNPCTQHPKYRSTVIRNLEQLQKLDDTEITQDERAASESEGLLFDEPPVTPVGDLLTSDLSERIEPAKDVPASVEAAKHAEASIMTESTTAESAAKIEESKTSVASAPAAIDGSASEEKLSDTATPAAASPPQAVATVSPATPSATRTCGPSVIAPLPSYALTEVRTAVLRLIRLLDQESLQLVLLTVRSRLDSQASSSPAAETPQQLTAGNSGTGTDISTSFSLDNL